MGSSSGSVLANSKIKYWVTENSSYIVSYGNANTNTYDDADLARADNDTDYIYRWVGVEGGSPLQARVEFDNRDSSSSPQQQTDSIYSYDDQDQLTLAYINDHLSRAVTFSNNGGNIRIVRPATVGKSYNTP